MKGKIFNAQEIQTMLLISFFSGGLISIYLLANPELTFWLYHPTLHEIFINILEVGLFIFLFLAPFAFPAILMVFLLGLPIGILYLLFNLLISKLKK